MFILDVLGTFTFFRKKKILANMPGYYIILMRTKSCSRRVRFQGSRVPGKCRPWCSPLQSSNLSMVNAGNERNTWRTCHLPRPKKYISWRALILLPVIQQLLEGAASLGRMVDSEDSTSIVEWTSSPLL